MGHFSPALFDFLFDLDVNNDRRWFDANRARYERDVREPLLRFVADIERPLHRRISRHVVADPRRQGGSIFRIQRDTRFSADKRPYKTNAGVQFRHEAGRNVHAPGLYLHLEPGNCFLGAGMWRPDTATLSRIRDRISTQPAAWTRTRRQVAAADLTIGDERLRRVPRGLDPAHRHADDLRLISFVASRPLTEEEVCADGFLGDAIDAWAGTRPLLRFLCRTLDLAF